MTNIRPATHADLPTIGRLGALLVRMHHELDAARFMEGNRNTESAYASFIGTQLAVTTVVVLVAERDGEVLGYCYAGLEPVDWMALRGAAGAVYDIVVDPAQRGHGVGRMLLEATVESLEARGARQIVLSTAQRNESAQRLFARAGFRATMIEMTRDL